MILALLGATVAIIAIGLWVDAKSDRIRQRDALIRDRYRDAQAGETR